MLCGKIWKAKFLISFHCRPKTVPYSNHFLSSSFLRLLHNQLHNTQAAFMAAKHPKDEAYLSTTIPKRIQLFQSIQAQILADRSSLPSHQIKITLPDGTMKEGQKWKTAPLDVAKEISKSLAANALIAQVDGVLWDMSRPLENDCELKLFTFDSDEGRDTFWHSSAHILGQSLEMEYGCKLCIGPCTTRGEGFYYDAFYDDLGLNDDHFKQIESGALKAVSGYNGGNASSFGSRKSPFLSWEERFDCLESLTFGWVLVFFMAALV